MTRTDTAFPDDPHFNITLQTERVSAICCVIDCLMEGMGPTFANTAEVKVMPHLTGIILDAVAQVDRLNRAVEARHASKA